MLQERQIRIIEVLQQKMNWMLGKELAKILEVSDRTIRSDIETINSYYNAAVIVSNRHKGYFLDRGVYLKNSQSCASMYDIQTPQNRVKYIIKELLFQKENVHINEMKERLCISDSAFEQDLRHVREMLKNQSTMNLKRSKQFLFLEGSEHEKRQLYKKLLEKETQGNFLNMNKLAELYSKIDLLRVKEILEDVFYQYDFHIRDMAMPMLMMHIGICLERLQQKHYVQTDFDREKIKETQEYFIACDFFEQVKQIIKIDYVEAEVLRFSMLLMGKRNNHLTSDEFTRSSNEFSIALVVDQMLVYLYDYFQIDLRYDMELKISLQIHIQGVIERQQQGVVVHNAYLQETKRHYTLVFEMAVCLGKFLEQHLPIVMNEAEVGLLALHLGNAYEKSKLIDKYRVLLICPHEQVLGKLCYQKILDRFHNRMEFIAHTQVFEKQTVLQLQPDFIITTLPVVHELNIPTIQISLFVNCKDESTIFYTLNDLDKQRHKEEFEKFMKDMLDPNLFFCDVEGTCEEDIIHFMCQQMQERHVISDDFLESVMQREKFSSTSFSVGIAIPHTLQVPSKKSCIAISMLKKPIQWGSYEVSIVLLLAMREQDQKLMGIFFDWLSHVASDTTLFANLLKVRNYESFVEAVIQT